MDKILQFVSNELSIKCPGKWKEEITEMALARLACEFLKHELVKDELVTDKGCEGESQDNVECCNYCGEMGHNAAVCKTGEATPDVRVDAIVFNAQKKIQRRVFCKL